MKKGQTEERICVLDGMWKRSGSLSSRGNIWVETHRWERGWNIPGKEISPEWLVHEKLGKTSLPYGYPASTWVLLVTRSSLFQETSLLDNSHCLMCFVCLFLLISRQYLHSHIWHSFILVWPLLPHENSPSIWRETKSPLLLGTNASSLNNSLLNMISKYPPWDKFLASGLIININSI